MPEPWDIEPLSNRIEDEAMLYTSNVNYRNNRLTLVYNYQTTKDHLRAIETKEHIAKLKQIRNDLGYKIYISNPQSAAQPGDATASINRTFLMLTLITVALAVIAAVRVYRYDPAGPNIKASSRYDLQGIGGWLILIAISLIIQPLRLAWQIATLWIEYPPQVWNSLTVPGADSYHWLWQPVIMFELSANICWFIFAVLMLVLFFNKRRAFPKLYMIYLFTTLAIYLVDDFIAGVIPAVAEHADIDDKKEIIRYAVTVCLWSWYLVKSRRVKNTFIEKAAPQSPIQRQIEPPSIPAPIISRSTVKSPVTNHSR